MKRKVLVGLLLIFLGVVAWHHALIWYALNQGYGQWRIIWNARPVKEVLEDPNFPDSLKSRLRLIDEIRQFAIDSLGLKDTENYKTLFDQKGAEVMWVVTACEAFRFEAKTWKFPIVGTVPYKGFFDREKALSLAKELEAEGWDVGLRNPGGWSTLGWFTDPILSGMLNRNDGDLASLIIHEMVHATIFVKDSVEFNENLASFIADSAAYHFLRHKYGADSQPYKTYGYEDLDYQHYSQHVLRGVNYLDSIYRSFSPTATIDEKNAAKQKAIKKIVSTMDTLTLYRFKIPNRFQERLPNNDYFMNYRRYQSKQSNFKDELLQVYGGDLRKMIASYQQKFPFL